MVADTHINVNNVFSAGFHNINKWGSMLIILAAGLGAALPVDTKADVCQPLQRVKLVAQDGAESDFFGRPVASDGDYVLVGVPWDDDRGSGSGAAYLFDINTGQQLLKLVPDDGETYDLFG